MHDGIVRRHAIRGLLVDEATQRLLLIQMLVRDTNTLIWLAPGGGREGNESVEACLLREIAEETGHRAASHIGPVWRRRHQFLLNGVNFDQSEEYYLVPTRRFEPISTHNPVALEAAAFRAFRWWSVEEINRAGSEIFVPCRLGFHLGQLLRSGPPTEPIEVGI